MLALKRLTDDACTIEKGRPFQTGIVLGKNEYLYAFTEADRGINLQIVWPPSPPKTQANFGWFLAIWGVCEQGKIGWKLTGKYSESNVWSFPGSIDVTNFTIYYSTYFHCSYFIFLNKYGSICFFDVTFTTHGHVLFPN